MSIIPTQEVACTGAGLNKFIKEAFCMKKNTWILIGLAVILVAFAALVLTAPAEAGKLQEAIAKTPSGHRAGADQP